MAVNFGGDYIAVVVAGSLNIAHDLQVQMMMAAMVAVWRRPWAD